MIIDAAKIYLMNISSKEQFELLKNSVDVNHLEYIQELINKYTEEKDKQKDLYEKHIEEENWNLALYCYIQYANTDNIVKSLNAYFKMLEWRYKGISNEEKV